MAATAFIGAGPLCRMTGITHSPLAARALASGIVVLDSACVTVAVTAETPEAKRRAAVLNASTDAALGVALLMHARRRRGSQRVFSALIALSLLGGAAAWTATT
jgi:hypothetical protein